MRIVRQLGIDEAADSIDFPLCDWSRLSVKHHERDGAVWTEGLVIAAIEVHVHEKVILEQRLVDDLVTVVPAAPDPERREKSFDTLVGEFLKDLPFVTRTGVERVPRHCYFRLNASNQTLPLRRLSNFFEGTRRSRTVARSDVAVNGIVNCCQYVVPSCFSEDWPSTSTYTPSLVEIPSVFIQNCRL